MNKAVGDTIREFRKKNKVSQEQLAEAIDSHQVYISEIENGLKLPSLTIIYSITSYFHISLSEFMAVVESKLVDQIA